MGFVRVSGYNEDDMTNNYNRGYTDGDAAGYIRGRNSYSFQEKSYTYPENTGGTVSLYPDNGYDAMTKVNVNAGNVYNKGKKDAFDYVTARFITPEVEDIREGEGTSYRNFIFGSDTSVHPWAAGQYYTNSYGIQSGKDYLFIMSANCFASPSEGSIETYNCNLLSYNYYIRQNQAGNSRIVYLVIHANGSTIGFRGNKESNGRAAIILAYRISA